MAAFNFPSSPSNGDTYTLNSVTYQWDGTKWVRYSAAVGAQGDTGSTGAQGAQGHQGHQGLQGAQAHISTSAPSSGVNNGDLWWESDTGDLAIYYNDGSSSQWIDINTGPRGAQGATGGTGAQGNQGHQGAGGSTGAQGNQGHQGHQGATAAAGAQGNQGHQGAAGAQGAQGHQGHQGAAGAQGAQGHQGHQGAAGSATISSNADNRVITGGSGTNLVGESTLTYNGSGTLEINDSGSSYTLKGSSAKHEIGASASDNDLVIQSNKNTVNAASNIIFKSSGSGGESVKERLRINSSGNVGVGDYSSTNLTHAFQALRTSGSTYVSSKNTGGNALFYAEASSGNTAKLELMQAGVGNFTLEVGSTNALMFKDDGNERLRINASGQLIVAGDGNTNSSYGLLQVNQKTDNDENGIAILNDANGRSMRIYVDGSNNSVINSGDGGSAPLVLNEGDGKVLIGSKSTGNEVGKLDIYHSADNDINNPHIRVHGPANNDCRIEFGSPVNTGEGGYIMYNDSDEGLYIGSRMATYSEVSICTGMNDGSPTSNVRFSIDASGRVTHPVQPGFECSNPDSYNTSGSPSNYVTSWTRIHHNYGSHFNGNTGYFTAPVNGRYLFTVHMTNVGHSSPHVAFGINGGTASGPSRSGTNYTELWHIGSDSGDGVNLTHIFDLSANDYVNVWLYGYTGTPDDPRCYFAGYLLG